MYRDVVVYLDGSEQSVRTASLHFRTLFTIKAAAQAVRTLYLAGDPLQDWRTKSPRKEDEGLEDRLRSSTLPGIHADLTDFTQGGIELFDKVLALSSASTRLPASEVSVWALYHPALYAGP